MSYQGVMRLAEEHRLSKPSPVTPQVDWLRVVKGCHEEALRCGGARFAGAWVRERVGWFPGLRPLARYGILVPEGEPTRGGARRYWRMPDPDGVARALRELGYL